MNEEFSPSKKNEYELAYLRVQAMRLFNRVRQFFNLSPNYFADPIYMACIRLENVCRMFSNIVNLEIEGNSREVINASRHPQSSFQSPYKHKFSKFHMNSFKKFAPEPDSSFSNLPRTQSGSNLNRTRSGANVNRTYSGSNLNRTYATGNVNRTYATEGLNVPVINSDTFNAGILKK